MPSTDSGFQLHPRLAADCVSVASLDLCEVLLLKNRRFPWLVLVPRVADARELIDLPRAQQHALMDEIAHVSEAMQKLHRPTKLNVATLGNMVPQLHIHIIARFEQDAAWPNPVWGTGQDDYTDTELAAALSHWRALLAPPHAGIA